ncbi:glycosyltransferase family 2 protein [Clostridium sartagoforme]|uniref:Glycosyltransferase family 2 protein n=1 Tax=Clostridium sartagoforme TaxID=84031 RepID=A0A4S2DJN7_9CLOT|nr:glycosyltransferase family 2 protein [Clostridium sartagoforme]TGY42416.1 glycosyltransferase family 2 protein [Clostridium sartagoforme]
MLNAYYLIFILSILSIWVSVIISIVFVFGAIGFVSKERKNPVDLDKYNDRLPSVTIMIPAHNEERVIASTLERILDLNYPKDLIQIIVINDNSSDSTGERIKGVQDRNPTRKINVITTNKETGGKGKAHALNLALKQAKGEWICIFDADAAPERNTLKFLIIKSFESLKYAAVFGRNKARNRNRNFLTKCINIELVVSQRVVNPGKWHLFKLGQIPGTNFIINKGILEKVGGWDTKAITEDTDLGFSLMKKGYLIAYESRAEAYQQEPEKLSVYIKQRTRWAKGNIYVVFKNLPDLFSNVSWRVKLDIIFYSLNYIWFLLFILISDGIFIFNILAIILNLINPSLDIVSKLSLNINFNFTLSFILMYVIFVLQMNVGLASDKGQATFENFLISCASYFTYSQVFILISLKASYGYLGDVIFKREAKWYKTERF